jgi:phosphoribosylcarboxyaminoimidazole (NCAIR) mutase
VGALAISKAATNAGLLAVSILSIRGPSCAWSARFARTDAEIRQEQLP